MAIPFVGKCFSTAAEFLAYLDGIKFGDWKPKFVTMHHTGGPTLKDWQGWQTRKPAPITDEQWMKNLASYYGKSKAEGGPADGPWRSGPHFFFTPAHFCVLSLPDRRGVHAKSFNAMSWGIECVGSFDGEVFTDELRDRYAEGLACLHIALNLDPVPFVIKQQGLHFHRDDPLTTKTCPGTRVKKDAMVAAIARAIDRLSGGSHEDDAPPPPPVKQDRIGRVTENELNIRAAAGAKYPVVGRYDRGDQISITGEAKNGETLWYQTADGWVAARYVDLT